MTILLMKLNNKKRAPLNNARSLFHPVFLLRNYFFKLNIDF